MNLQNKKILVTGADGFIGSHLTEELIRRGFNVRAFVLYNSFNSWGWLDHAEPEIKKSLDVFSGDVRDPHGVKTAMKGCDVVFHLAALIGIPYSYHSPDTYVDTNIKGTLNIVQAARELGVAKVLHTSTSEVYGTARFVPITEEHPLQGNRLIRPVKSVRIKSPCPFIFPLARLSVSSGPSTLTAHGNRRAPSSRLLLPRLLQAAGKSNWAPCTPHETSITSKTQ